MVGPAIEWYDYYLYGTAASLVFSTAFFPNLSHTAGVLASFATYAVGFGARPIGGLLFGYFGDRRGRKAPLVASLLTMGCASIAIGLLPSYNSIGVLAPILLVFLRLVQGLGLGGESSGAVILAVEHADSKRRNLFGGFPQMGVPIGLILANLVYFLVTTSISSSVFTEWAWRIPFLLSAVLVVVGVWIRSHLEETPEFKQMVATKSVEQAPAVVAMKGNYAQIILTVLLSLGSSAVSYVFFTFTLTYGGDHLGFTHDRLLLGLTAASVVWLVFIPIWNSLADRKGRKPVFVTASALLVVVAATYVAALNTKSIPVIAVSFLAMGVVIGAVHGLQGVIMADVFPANVRYSGMGWILGVASILGGASPFAAQAIYDSTGGSWGVTLYVSTIAAVSLVSATILFRVAPTSRGRSALRQGATVAEVAGAEG